MINRIGATRLFPLWVGLISLGLSMIGLTRPSYWFDEAATVAMASRSWPDQFRVAEHVDAVHTQFYAVMHPWVSLFGVSELSTRMLPAIVFAFAAGSFAFLLSRLRTPFVAVAGSLLFVILPGIAWAGREARAYAFILALAVWSLVLLDALLRRRGAFGKRPVRVIGWVGYAAMPTLMIGFSVITATMVIGHLAFVLIVRRRDIVPFVLAWFGVALASAPLLLRSVAQGQQVDWIDNSLTAIAAKVALGQLFWGPRYNDGVSLSMFSAVLLMLVSAALVAVAAVSAARSVRDRGPAASTEPQADTDTTAPTLTSAQAVWFGLVMFAGPTLVLAAATVAGMNVYQERYVLYAALGFCLVAAEGFAALRSRCPILIVAAVLVVVTCVPQFVAARGELSKAGENYRALAHAAAAADQVVYAESLARSVTMAYPELVQGDDLLLKQDAIESGTLWGTNEPLETLGDRLRPGSVAVLAPPETEQPALDEALAANNCSASGPAVPGNRYSLTTYVCDPE